MSDYFDRIERQLVGQIEAGARPERPKPAGRMLAPVVAMLVVVAVAAVFLTARGGTHNAAGGPTGAGAGVTFTATPTEPGQSVSALVARSLPILRARLHAALPHLRFQVSSTGASVSVRMPGQRITADLRRQITALAAPGRLHMYDWEESVLTLSGGPAAAGLARQDAVALTLSQGDGSQAPGEIGAGSVSAGRALGLASRQPGLGAGPSHYYALGAGCASAADRSRNCPLVGPAVSAAALTQAAPPSLAALSSPVRVRAGVTLVQAAASRLGKPASGAQYFVLRGEPALDSAMIDRPSASTDESGSPDVVFGLTATGARRFQQLTATVARRGEVDSRPGLMLDQHIAIVVDGQVLSVPSIDFKQYPDGVKATSADVSGTFTPTTARDLAAVLRYGPLPAQLTSR